MPALIWLMLAAILTVACDETAVVKPPTSPTPTPTAKITIQGPNRLEVSDQAQFDLTFVDASGVTRVPTLIAWSSLAPELLRIDALSGRATALKPGTAEIRAAVEDVFQRLIVTVVPKLRLEIDVEPEIEIGESVEAEAFAVVNTGDGDREISLTGISEFVPLGTAAALVWSTPQPSIISVTPVVGQPVAAHVRGVQAGSATVKATAAGLTAEASVKVVAPPLITIPVTNAPIPPATPPTTPPVTPADLNGLLLFDSARRGASDCGLNLLQSIGGSLEVQGVDSVGRSGRARLNYGTIYDFLTLTAVLSGADTIDFESGPLQAPVPGYDVYISGQLAVRQKNGSFRFYWVQVGQPRSAACAIFEGATRRP